MDAKFLIKLQIDDFLNLKDKRLLKDRVENLVKQLADEFDIPISNCYVAELETEVVSVLEQKDIK